MDSKQDPLKPDWWTPAHDHKLVAVSLNDYLAIYARYTALKEKFEALNDYPAKRTWVGLNHVEIDSQSKKYDNAVYFVIGALWAEAKLKEKNNG